MRKNLIKVLSIAVIALIALGYLIFGANNASNVNFDVAGKLNLKKSFQKPQSKGSKIQKRNQSIKLKNIQTPTINKKYKDLTNLLSPYEHGEGNTVLKITVPFQNTRETSLLFHNKRQNQDEVARLTLLRESSRVINAQVNDLNNPINPRTVNFSEEGFLFLNTETANDYSVELIDFNYSQAHLKIVSNSGPIKLLLEKDFPTLPLWYSYENGQVNSVFPSSNNRQTSHHVIDPLSADESQDPIIKFNTSRSTGTNLANVSKSLSYVPTSENPDFDNPNYLYYYNFTAQDFDNEKIWLEVTNYNLNPRINWSNLNGFNLRFPRDIYDTLNRQYISRNILIHDQMQVYQLIIGDMTDHWVDIDILYPNGTSERIRHTYKASSGRTNIFKLEIPNSDKKYFLQRYGRQGNYLHEIISNDGPLELSIQKNPFHNYTHSSYVRPLVSHNANAELMIENMYKLEDITTFVGNDYKVTYVDENDNFTHVEFDEPDEDLTILTSPPQVAFEPNLNTVDNVDNVDNEDPLRLSTGSSFDYNYVGKFVFNTNVSHSLKALKFDYVTSCSIKAEHLSLFVENRYGREVLIGNVFLDTLPAGLTHEVELEVTNNNLNTIGVGESTEVLAYLAVSQRNVDETVTCMTSDETEPDLRLTEAQRAAVQRIYNMNEEEGFTDPFQDACRALDSPEGCSDDMRKMVRFDFNEFEYLHGTPYFGTTGARLNLLIDPIPTYYNTIVPTAL